MRLGPIVVFAAAACGPAKRVEISNDGSGTLGAVLEREVGAGVPVAIVPGPDGLRAISADGKRVRQLAPGPVPWAIVDQRGGAIWFGDRDFTKVFAIDLEATGTPRIATVVTEIPPVGDARVPLLVNIQYVDLDPDGDPIWDTIRTGDVLQPHVIIELSTELRIAGDPGTFGDPVSLPELEDLLKKAVIRDRALLATFVRRGAGKRTSLEVPDGPELRVDGVDPSRCNGDAEKCGRAEPIAQTKLWRVLAGLRCTDACYWQHQLYDPAAKRFLDGDWAKLINAAWVARDGSAFVSNGVVARFDSGPLQATPKSTALGGGWLGGAYYYQ